MSQLISIVTPTFNEEENIEQLQITLSSIISALKNAIRFEDITLQMLNLIIFA